jgi:hypothetical protein
MYILCMCDVRYFRAEPACNNYVAQQVCCAKGARMSANMAR